MILYPNAKVNIGLNVLFKRSDGFHELETLMHPVGLTDILTINKSGNKQKKINFATTGIHIDGNHNDNIIYKACELIGSNYNLPSLDIHLHKTIPFGAGLGGGSADGAFTIKGINELCNLNMSINNMEKLAAELGSDCPFFIKNRPAITKGRGEIIKPYDIDLKQYRFVIVVPPMPINTKKAYSLITPNTPKLNLFELLKFDITKWRSTVVNDFEDSVFPQYPEIKNIKEELYKQGAVYASLSGSGSAVFGVFKDAPNLKQVFPKNYFIWI